MRQQKPSKPAMQVKGLQYKLLLGAIAISVIVALSSMLAASWITSRQYLSQSNVFLTKASQLINDNLSDRKANLLAASHQLAAQKNLGSTIWYLTQYAQANIDRDMLFNTYQQLVKEIYEIGRVSDLARIAIYDSAGNLVSFALLDGEQNEVGFVERFPTLTFQVASLNEGEEFSKAKLQKRNLTKQINFNFGRPLPQQESVYYAQLNGMVVIESDVPIMGESFDPKTGKPQIKQLGLVTMVHTLDQAFVDQISKLTDTKINVFTSQGFSVGLEASYRTPNWGKGQSESGTPTRARSFNEITIGDVNFYQGLIPLYTNQQMVGAIATLRSEDEVQNNIWAMIKTLGLIAASSMLLILPVSWYFAASISRPLKVLSQIFRSVENDGKSATLNDELNRLEKEKIRDDELGDLTQSFVAMNHAINQKIQQISELNASLEHKVEERTAALMARERELRTMLENTPDSIARYDHNCRRIYVNGAFDSLTDGGNNSALGKKPSEFPGGSNFILYETKILEVFATGNDAQFELKWEGKNHQEICTHIRLTAERDAYGTITSVLGVGRDITELNEYRNELEKKELAKTRFLAAAGHDLRQPLAAANLFIDALKFSSPTSKQEELIQRLDRAMVTFNGLLDALLNVSKLDSGTIKPDYTAINAAEIFNWLEQNLAPLAHEKNLGFKLYFPLRETLVVNSDIGLIKSVLMNLVSNAIKYSNKGAVLVSVRRRKDDALFQVWDTGIGISTEHIKRIYDEFYQINNPQRDRTRGIGLGLSIAKRALSLLGGEIKCNSKIGRGTVFEFRLPLSKEVIPHIPPLTSMITDIDYNSFAQGKCFVVLEDDTLVAQSMINLLESMGGEVKLFHSAEEALRHSNIEYADYFISDYMLGSGCNGIQFLNQLHQKLEKPINAVLITGDTSPTLLAEMKDCPWLILHKPINLTQLIAGLMSQESGVAYVPQWLH